MGQRSGNDIGLHAITQESIAAVCTQSCGSCRQGGQSQGNDARHSYEIALRR